MWQTPGRSQRLVRVRSPGKDAPPSRAITSLRSRILFHVTDREKWFEILRKQQTYTKAAFDNEVLGVPSDESVKMLTKEDLVKASHGRPNTLEAALEVRKRYSTTVIGVDWGGGGTTLQSFTTMAILGYMPTEKKVDVLYMERVPIGKSSMEGG